MEAVRAAIADAGLTADDIDGIATLGDTPAAEVNAALKIEAADCGSGFGTGGLLQSGDVGVPCGRRATGPPRGGLPDHSNAGRHRPGEAGRERARPATSAHVRDARG